MIVLISAGFIALLQFICGMIALRFRTDKLTDLAYGWTFFLVVWWLYMRASSQDMIHTLLVVLLSLRSVRLALYLFLRVLALGKDKRFDGIREQKHSFMKFWVLQAVVILLLLLPVIWTMEIPNVSLTWYTIIWIICLLWGVFLESLADRQKFRFKQQYPTRWCAVWVRSKIQYPNYLGEILVWIGVYLICLSALQGYQVVVWLISPFTITWLLLFVTWIPPLEEAHKQQWWTEQEWKTYTEQTPKLVPYVY